MGCIAILALVSFILRSNRHQTLMFNIGRDQAIYSKLGIRKSHKNVHVYTCSPYVKCHGHILAILVYIQYVFFSYGPTLFCGTIVLEQHLSPAR